MSDQTIAGKIDAAFEVLTDRESRDWKSIDDAAAYLRRITNGAAMLGRTVAAQNRNVLAAIGGAPDLIHEDGDGDWQCVWERLAELRPERDAALAQRDRARDMVVTLEQELAEANRRRSIGGTPPEYTHNTRESE